MLTPCRPECPWCPVCPGSGVRSVLGRPGCIKAAGTVALRTVMRRTLAAKSICVWIRFISIGVQWARAAGPASAQLHRWSAGTGPGTANIPGSAAPSLGNRRSIRSQYPAGSSPKWFITSWVFFRYIIHVERGVWTVLAAASAVAKWLIMLHRLFIMLFRCALGASLAGLRSMSYACIAIKVKIMLLPWYAAFWIDG